MEILTTRSAMGAWSDARRAEGAMVGFVPTMGALHEGHLTLVRRARQRCNRVVVSLFVNPAQFGPTEDFARYPRTLEADTRLLEGEGCDALYLPAVEEIYPPGHATVVRVAGLGEVLEGAHRPGHFQGVATVVAILFNHVRPHGAFFGRKDYQQLAVIRRMVEDLGIPLFLEGVETVREPDGLAMSSRNRYLDPAERQRAGAIHRGLAAARTARRAGEGDPARLEGIARQVLAGAGISEIDYVALRHPRTLEPLPAVGGEDPVLLIAARVGSTRLIDNMVLDGTPDDLSRASASREAE